MHVFALLSLVLYPKNVTENAKKARKYKENACIPHAVLV